MSVTKKARRDIPADKSKDLQNGTRTGGATHGDSKKGGKKNAQQQSS